MDRIQQIIRSSIATKEQIFSNPELLQRVEKSAQKIISSYQNKGKLLLCGNGGSAADAQHIAAEFTGRFYYDRDPLFAEALHINTSYLTAVANDYSFDEIYSRMVKAMANEGDVLIGLSTSGNSENIIRAFQQAKKMGLLTIGFTGETGGQLAKHCDILINVPSSDTPRIQESHIMLGHIICEIVESTLFPR